MGRLIINLKTEPRSKYILIDMTDEIEISKMMPTLIKIIDYPEKNANEELYHYWFSDTKGNPINQHLTPNAAGIKNRSVLFLNRGLSLPKAVTEEVQSNQSTPKLDESDYKFEADISTTIQRNVSPQDIRGKLDIPPSWKKISVD